MAEYISLIEGKLSPPPMQVYKGLEVRLPNFSIKVEKEVVTALPRTNIPFEKENATLRLLQNEISPLLAVLGTYEGRTITLEITDVKYPGLKKFAESLLITYTISGSVPSVEELGRKIQWACADPIYRDLLDFFTEALAAPNPRPAGYKMVERLERKFGNCNKACSTLDIQDLKPIVADQSKYRGDRHAKYHEHDVPARLNPVERSRILEHLKHIINCYERRVCAEIL